MPNNDNLVVNFHALTQASADISSALSKMQSSLDTLESDAAKLVATWRGEALEAYAQRQRQWRAAANDLARMLGDIRAALDESASNYHSTEKKNVGMFQ
jgi:6 kDa early secretory antigenic target